MAEVGRSAPAIFMRHFAATHEVDPHYTYQVSVFLFLRLRNLYDRFSWILTYLNRHFDDIFLTKCEMNFVPKRKEESYL